MGRIGRSCGRNARLTRVCRVLRRVVSPTANPVGGLQGGSHQMYVPAPPAQHALALAPLGIVSTTPTLAAPSLGRALSTTLRVHSARLNVLDGRRVSVTGTLSPGLSGRTVTLQTVGRHGWSTVAHTLTRAKGRFRLRYLP